MLVLGVTVLIWILGYVECSSENIDDDIQWWYGSQKRVSDSKCGRNIALTFETNRMIYLSYDGAPLNGTCVINITIYNPISKYSIICLVLNNADSYPEHSDCRENFKFYFGEYPTRESEKFYSCSNIHEPVCDYDYNTRGYAAFNSWDSSENQRTIEVKVYVLSGFPKRPTTSRPNLQTEVSWSSWTSGSLDDENNSTKKEHRLSLIIVGAVVGFVLVLVVCIHFCHGQMVKTAFGSRNTEERSRTDRESNGIDTSYELGSRDVPSRFVEDVTDTDNLPSSQALINRSDYNDVNETLNAIQESRHRIEPSAPDSDLPDDTSLTDPPPSYRSLFGDRPVRREM